MNKSQRPERKLWPLTFLSWHLDDTALRDLSTTVTRTLVAPVWMRLMLRRPILMVLLWRMRRIGMVVVWMLFIRLLMARVIRIGLVRVCMIVR